MNFKYINFETTCYDFWFYDLELKRFAVYLTLATTSGSAPPPDSRTP